MKKEKLQHYWSLFKANSWRVLSFFFLICTYLIFSGLEFICSLKILKKSQFCTFKFRENKVFKKITTVFDHHDPKTISKIELIELAINNLRVKRSRNIVTIGGMAVGIAAIVFLMSVGYGLQDLVVKRVAGLEEVKQADLYPPRGGKLTLNDQTLSDLTHLEHVESVLPLIALVARVDYNNSVTDMPAYGVTTEYLEKSALKPVRGRIFDNNLLDLQTASDGEIKNDNLGLELDRGASASAELLASQIVETADGEWVELSEEEQSLADLKKVRVVSETAKEAIVNRAMLDVLGIEERDAIGQEFRASFTVIANLLAKDQEKFVSYPVNYKIVGINSEENSPLFYVPLIDFKSMGIVNYSQLKLVADKEENLTQVRNQAEAMGFLSSSVADTITQINSLFATARKVFALMGFVALAVASLGMFNTLTVSLLERIREVGLMKALGMASEEVRELFITESMIMSFYGGVIGLAVGFIAGKLLGVFLTMYAIGKGVGVLNVTFIPIYLVIIIILLSLVIGIITGFYPARKATKVSALNALRYE